MCRNLISHPTEQFSKLIFVRKIFLYRPCEAYENSVTISIGLKEMVPIKTAHAVYHENGPLTLCMLTGVPDLDAAYKEAIKQEPLSRGHMNPLAINSFNKSFMQATFTLTNAVPQYVASNSGPWQKFEATIRSYAQEVCGSLARQGTLYLLTGTSEFSLTSDLGRKPVQDSSIKVSRPAILLDEMTLVIPRAVWTAGCCLWNEAGQEFGMVRRAESFAVMSNNVRDKKLLNQTRMSVLKLERHLTAPGSPPVNLFPGDPNCRLPQSNLMLA